MTTGTPSAPFSLRLDTNRLVSGWKLFHLEFHAESCLKTPNRSEVVLLKRAARQRAPLFGDAPVQEQVSHLNHKPDAGESVQPVTN